LNISVDPHSHENVGHNYADVAYLIDSLGVEPTSVIGGHIWDPDDRNFTNWERFTTPMQGQKFPWTSWKGDILMGHGTSKHVNDPAPSGVWKPKGIHDFWSHDSTGTVYAVGQYKSSIKGIIELINLYDSGIVPPEKLLTTTIGTNQFQLETNYIGMYEQTILKPLIELQDSGLVKIILFEELIDEWKEKYDSTGYIYNAPEPTDVKTQDNKICKFNLKQNYPNPFNSSTAISYQLTAISFVQMTIYNMNGKRVRVLSGGEKSPGYHTFAWEGKDDFGNSVSSGMYFYQLKTNDDFSVMHKMLMIK